MKEVVIIKMFNLVDIRLADTQMILPCELGLTLR